MEELKRQIRAIDLAVSAGKKRQSERTGFVHLFPNNEEASDTVPLYENFCFALALLRQKTAESVGEAKALFERLLAFRIESSFPIFLHDYPRCFNPHQGLKIAPILVHAVRLFGPILGPLASKMEDALQMILTQSKAPDQLAWENRRRALLGLSLLPEEPTDWIEWLITRQLAKESHVQLPFDPQLQLFSPSASIQERFEPRPHPIEWLLAEPHFSERLLRDHPHQLLAAPLFPISFEPIACDTSIFWKGTSMIHSLYAKTLTFNLAPGVEMGRDLFEASLFCNQSSETELFVSGKKATSFRLGDVIAIQTPSRTIEARFELTEGEGDFMGHIFRANRPGQVACRGAAQYEAYDWHIGLRTLRRSDTAQVRIHLN